MIDKNVNKAELSGDKACYGMLFSRTKYKERFEKLLFKFGIKKVIFDRDSVSKVDLIFSDITLVVLPDILDVVKISNETKKFGIKGLSFVVHPAYDILDKDCLRIKKENIVLLDYYEKRNLIVLYFNPFPIIPRVNTFKIILDFITENIGKLSGYDNKNIFMKNLMLKNASFFVKGLKNQHNKLIDEIETSQNRIEKHGRDIICEYESIRIKNETLRSIRRFLMNFNKDFESRINEIRKLPFVKGVEILSDGIKVEYGDVYVNYEKTEYYIGDMYIIIKPDSILIYNRNNSKNGYPHPHVTSRNSPCFGNSTTEIYSLLAKLDLRKLVFMISQFLVTYSSLGTPYISILRWGAGKKKSKKDLSVGGVR